MYLCSPGLKGYCRTEEDPRRPPALHYSQHYRVGQAPPDVSWPRPGCAAGRAGELGSEGEYPQPEGGAGHRQGQWEAGSEEEEEAKQSQSPELPEEEKKERRPNAAKEDRGRGEEEKKSTQEGEGRAISSRGCNCIMRTATVRFFHFVLKMSKIFIIHLFINLKQIHIIYFHLSFLIYIITTVCAKWFLNDILWHNFAFYFKKNLASLQNSRHEACDWNIAMFSLGSGWFILNIK